MVEPAFPAELILALDDYAPQRYDRDCIPPETYDLIGKRLGADALLLSFDTFQKIRQNDQTSSELTKIVSILEPVPGEPVNRRWVATPAEIFGQGAERIYQQIHLGAACLNSMLKDAGAVAAYVNREKDDGNERILWALYPRREDGRGGVDYRREEKPEAYAKIVCDGIDLALEHGARSGTTRFKVPYTGSPESFRQVVVKSHDAGIPVVVAGGSIGRVRWDIVDTLQITQDNGADGAAIGRVVYEPHQLLGLLITPMIVHAIHPEIPTNKLKKTMSDVLNR